MYFPLHVFTDMRRCQTFALIPETEKHIIVVVVFYKRKSNNIMRIAIRKKFSKVQYSSTLSSMDL